MLYIITIGISTTLLFHFFFYLIKKFSDIQGVYRWLEDNKVSPLEDKLKEVELSLGLWDGEIETAPKQLKIIKEIIKKD